MLTQVVNGLEQKSPALADRIVVAASVGLANRAKRKAMSIVMGDDTSSALKGGAREQARCFASSCFSWWVTKFYPIIPHIEIFYPIFCY